MRRNNDLLADDEVGSYAIVSQNDCIALARELGASGTEAGDALDRIERALATDFCGLDKVGRAHWYAKFDGAMGAFFEAAEDAAIDIAANIVAEVGGNSRRSLHITALLTRGFILREDVVIRVVRNALSAAGFPFNLDGRFALLTVHSAWADRAYDAKSPVPKLALAGRPA